MLDTKKGLMETSMILGLVGTVLLGTIIGGLNSRFLDQAEGHNEDLMDNLDGLERKITLSDDSGTAKNQINSLLHFNVLRGAHCGILAEANANLPVLLEQTKSVDGNKFQNLPCDTQEEVLNVNQPLDNLNNVITSEYGEEDGQDQEGRYGNIKFTYPGDSHIIINSKDFFREPNIGQIVDIGDGKTSYSGPGRADDWAGVYYKDANSGGGSNEIGIHYYPDPSFGIWTVYDNTLDIPDPPYEDDNYPYGQFVPVMENVPVVNSTPLTRTLSGSGTKHSILSNRRDYEDHQVKFDMVICGGSKGTIQANSGGPYQDGEATEDGDEKRMYPFVRLDSGSPTGCVEEHVMDNSDYERAASIDSTPREFEIDMKLGDENYEGGRNSPCGPGGIFFENENGYNFQIKFKGSDSCDMQVEWEIGTFSNPIIGDTSSTYYVDQGETAEFRIVEGEDARVYIGDNEYNMPNDNPVEITKIQFRGSGEGLKFNPDYFEGVIERFEVDYGSALGSYSLLDQRFRDYFSVNEQGTEEAGWHNGQYRLYAGIQDNAEVEWNLNILDDATQKIEDIECEGFEDARSDETSTFEFGGNNFEGKCRLHPMDLEGISMNIYSENSDKDIMSAERYIKTVD